MRRKFQLLAGSEIVGVVLHESGGTLSSLGHSEQNRAESRSLVVALRTEAHALCHEILRRDSGELVQPVEILERIGERAYIFPCDELVESRFIFSLLADSGDVVRRHRVLFGVFSHFSVYLGFGNAVGDLHYVAYTVVVHVPAEAYLAFNAVAVSDCDITHIVSKHCNSQSPAERYCGSRMSESADLLYNVLVLIVACNDLALNAEPCADEPELAVAVRRLVEVHEVHVDAVVGELLVELRMQVEHWLFQGFQRSYPHLGG